MPYKAVAAFLGIPPEPLPPQSFLGISLELSLLWSFLQHRSWTKEVFVSNTLLARFLDKLNIQQTNGGSSPKDDTCRLSSTSIQSDSDACRVVIQCREVDEGFELQGKYNRICVLVSGP